MIIHNATLTGSISMQAPPVISGSLTLTGSINATGDITASSARFSNIITAQTLVVQTVSSSVSYISGSTQFGSSSINTHQFTGSLFVTGAFTQTGTNTTSSFASLVGIGTTTPTETLEVNGNAFIGAQQTYGFKIGIGDFVPNATLKGYLLWGAAATYGGNNGDMIYIPRQGNSCGHRFYTGNTIPTEKVRISDSGNLLVISGSVGIGVTSPNSKLSIVPNAGNYNASINIAGNAPNANVDDLVLGFNVYTGDPYTPVRVNTSNSAWLMYTRTAHSPAADGNSTFGIGYIPITGGTAMYPIQITGATGSANAATVAINGTLQTTTGIFGNSYAQTSATASGGISVIDTGIAPPPNAIYLVTVAANPNGGGSGLYYYAEVGYIICDTQFNGSAAVNYINYTKVAGGPSSGTPGVLTVSAVFLVAGVEVSNTTTYQPANSQIRIKISGYNSSFIGQNQQVRLTQIQ